MCVYHTLLVVCVFSLFLQEWYFPQDLAFSSQIPPPRVHLCESLSCHPGDGPGYLPLREKSFHHFKKNNKKKSTQPFVGKRKCRHVIRKDVKK